MISALAMVHLVVIAQVSGPPRLVTPDEEISDEEHEAGPLPRRQPAATPGDESEQSEAASRADRAPPSGEARQEPPPATAEQRAAAQRLRQLSLLSAEPLHGGSAGLAWAGWSSLGAMYAIGFTERDDMGIYLDYDVPKSESRLGALYRRPLARAGPFDVAGRLAVAWYVNLGAGYFDGYFDEKNHSDNGLEVVPALVFSEGGLGGVFSITGEAPMTVTMKYKAGFLFSPRISLAFEMPLYPEVTVGARVGIGYRAGAGDAPLSKGRSELQFQVLVGYQVL